MVRVIGHLDLDYFYAQVEEVQNPRLRGKPVLVCVFSGRTEDSGVVGTANYAARDLGVKAGMPIALAKRSLEGSDPVLIKMDHRKYELVSERVMGIVEEEVDVFEKTGIDEGFFDISDKSGGDYQSALAIAKKIKDEIKKAEQLTCSIGLGRSKAVAKIGSDMNKPDGLTLISPESTEETLAPMQAKRLYGVGPKTDGLLKAMGILTIGGIARADPQVLERSLGRKLSVYLQLASTGSDTEPVRPGLPPTQFGRIITLKKDTRSPTEVMEQLSQASEQVRSRLAASSKAFKTLSVIGILTDLSTHTKTKTFDAPPTDAEGFHEAVLSLFKELSGSVDKDFRRAGLRVAGLSDVGNQASLSEFVSQ